MKPGLSREFHKPWSVPLKITTKISDLNYEIADEKGKKQTAHVIKLKPAHNPEIWKSKTERKVPKKLTKIATRSKMKKKAELNLFR